MTPALLPRPACRRHVAASAVGCPFCAEPVAEVFRATPPRVLPRRRMGRAALLAFGASVAAGCGAADEPAGDPPAAVDPTRAPDPGPAATSRPRAPSPGDLGGAVPEYGAPAEPVARPRPHAPAYGLPPPADRRGDPGGDPVPAYGAPVPGAPSASPDLGGAVEAYGAPAPPVEPSQP